jgi:hypothetical protein
MADAARACLDFHFGTGLGRIQAQGDEGGFGRMSWLAGGFYSRTSMVGIFPSLLSPFKQFTLFSKANDLPNENSFEINPEAAHDPVLVSKTARHSN